MIVRFTWVFAVGGLVSLLLLILLGSAGVPGYSHVSQFISELGARGAPHEWFVRYAGFLPAGIFVSLFAVAAFTALPRSVPATLGFLGIGVYALGYVAAAFFPCDPGCRPPDPSISQIIHNLVGLAGYVIAPTFLALLAWSARRWPGGRRLALLASLAAGLALAGLLSLSPDSPYAGLSQRLIEASVLGWIVACAWYVRSRQG